MTTNKGGSQFLYDIEVDLRGSLDRGFSPDNQALRLYNIVATRLPDRARFSHFYYLAPLNQAGAAQPPKELLDLLAKIRVAKPDPTSSKSAPYWTQVRPTYVPVTDPEVLADAHDDYRPEEEAEDEDYDAERRALRDAYRAEENMTGYGYPSGGYDY